MALNHKPGVSTATRQLVLDAAEKYGYDFSRIAEKHTTSGAIYFVIYKKHGTVVADTPFFSQVSEGISQGCKKNDYRLKISYIYEDEDTITKQIEEIQYSVIMVLKRLDDCIKLFIVPLLYLIKP